MALRVLLVEDDAPTRASQVAALGRHPDRIVLVAAVATAEEAIDVVRSRALDAALVDLQLPGAPGDEVIRACAELPRPVPCVALTVFDDPVTVQRVLRAGAAGFVLKDEPEDRIVQALDDAIRGWAPLSSRVARHVVEDAVARGRDPAPAADAGSARGWLACECCPAGTGSSLTARERDVLELLAKGLTYAECAGALGIGVGTVQDHVKRLYRKLDVTTKAEASAWAVRHGLLE